MLTHSPRQAHVWLIFDVRQKMTREVKVAVCIYWGAVISILALAVVGNVVGPDAPRWFRIGAWFATGFLLVGQLLCWRGGWIRYSAESTPFAGKHVDKFVVYVLFAPISLLFSDITFPRWGF